MNAEADRFRLLDTTPRMLGADRTPTVRTNRDATRPGQVRLWAIVSIKSPGPDSHDRLGRNFYPFLRPDLPEVLHPGMRVFNVENAPGKWASDDEIETSTRGNAWASLR